MKLLVLAGTRDGRELAAALKERGHEAVVSTLSGYGAELAWEQGLPARSGALNARTLRELVARGEFAAVVDATHPYAEQIKEMAQGVCAEMSLPYLRWQRPPLELEDHPLLHWAEDIPAAAVLAARLGERIMLTTGGNKLAEWAVSPPLQDKSLFIRVLPTSEILARCEELGFRPKQIIAAQGPFSQEWNEAMFKQLNIDVVVAKESGRAGGTEEKVRACRRLNIPLVILKRPLAAGQEPGCPGSQGCSLAEFIKQLEEII